MADERMDQKPAAATLDDSDIIVIRSPSGPMNKATLAQFKAFVLAAVSSGSGVDYIVATNPITTTNPAGISALWVNFATGEIFVCTDNTTDANVWKGSAGSVVSVLSSSGHIFSWGGIYDSVLRNRLKTISNSLANASVTGGEMCGKWLKSTVGSAGFVNLGDLFRSPADFSFSAWFVVETISGSPVLIARYDGSSKRVFKIWIHTTGELGFLFTDDPAVYDSNIFFEPVSGATITASTPFHVAMTVDIDGDIKLYLDGSEVVAGTSLGYANVDTPTWLCNQDDVDEQNGLLDGGVTSFEAYDRALTQAEITAIYNEGA